MRKKLSVFYAQVGYMNIIHQILKADHNRQEHLEVRQFTTIEFFTLVKTVPYD